MRVTLDTNILVSGLLWPGPSNTIFRLAECKLITLCVNGHILNELQDVLHRSKFKKRLEAIDETPRSVLSALTDLCEIFATTPGPPAVKKDPTDNNVIACAIASNSRFIISGDHHLLDLKAYNAIPILTPSEFLKRFSPTNA